MGKIAGMLAGEQDTQTPLQQKLSQLGKYLGFVALAACAVIFVVGLINGIHVLEIFMTSVSLAVSAIPEGLPAIVTIVLAIGVQRMVKKNALIRRLPAVETLGSASVICSDKTGTLTQNRMTLTKVWVEGQQGLEAVSEENSQMARHLLTLGTVERCVGPSPTGRTGRRPTSATPPRRPFWWPPTKTAWSRRLSTGSIPGWESCPSTLTGS